MRRLLYCAILLSTAVCCTGTARATTSANSPELKPEPLQIVINVDKQKLEIVRSGAPTKRFPVSTSKFGLGDDWRSYKTPIGLMQVCSKFGDNLPLGAVIKGGHFTGEVLAPNAPGRDPIVTRVIRLQGLEEQNRHALLRGIYIHGTPEEDRIGKPVSWGCIRMRSKDLLELYQTVEIGTKVLICTKKTAPQEPHWSLFSWWS